MLFLYATTRQTLSRGSTFASCCQCCCSMNMLLYAAVRTKIPSLTSLYMTYNSAPRGSSIAGSVWVLFELLLLPAWILGMPNEHKDSSCKSCRCWSVRTISTPRMYGACCNMSLHRDACMLKTDWFKKYTNRFQFAQIYTNKFKFKKIRPKTYLDCKKFARKATLIVKNKHCIR